MSASELQKAVDRLIKKEPEWAVAIRPSTQGAKAPSRGVGRPSASGPGGGFAEADYLQREYWPAQTMTTSDGLFTVEVRPIKSILLDSGSRATFKEPVEPPPP